VLRLNSLLTQELAILERSSKESTLFYEYKDETELIKAQRFLIDIAFKAMTYIREDKPDICEVSWSILTAILKRG
jgi:thiazole synthase ThiGH ThiG subunit